MKLKKLPNELKTNKVKVNLLINAVGFLHDESFFPEKNIRY